MHCAEHQRYGIWLAVLVTALLSGCATVSLAPTPPPRAEPARPAPAPPPAPRPVLPSNQPKRPVTTQVLATPPVPRNAAELRRVAAQRLVDANPDRVYLGKPQDILLAIPVLEVELNADGSVKHITVLRKPGQALETVQIAIDAVYRAAPYGDVSRLPRPWRFVETFLFNDDHRFKPRTLDGD